MHIHALKKRNKATYCYLIKLASQSRGNMLYVSPNIKNKMHIHALKKRNKATHCYLITLSSQSRGTCYMLALI